VSTRHRLAFLDAVRGIALILMVLNHTARDWMDGTMRWGRYYLIYGTLLFPAPLFLFLAGFCLPITHAPSALAFLRRGAVIVAAGYLLNVLLTPEQPWTNGGVLQTIGLAVMLLGPLVPSLHRRGVRAALVTSAVILYAGYVMARPSLMRWAAEWPRLSHAFFNDFPPWPWLGAAIVGLVLGSVWMDARATGAEVEDRFFRRAAMAGVACALGYLAWEWWKPTTPRFGFPRDWSLNNHWTPRGVTLLLIAAGVAMLLAAAFWLMERRHREAPWLVTLGQTALMLYFIHQLIELTLVNKWLGIRFNAWPRYWAANAVFLVLLVGLGRAWRAVKARRAATGNPVTGVPRSGEV
jgi:uncharacterized membrane protein